MDILMSTSSSASGVPAIPSSTPTSNYSAASTSTFVSIYSASNSREGNLLNSWTELRETERTTIAFVAPTYIERAISKSDGTAGDITTLVQREPALSALLTESNFQCSAWKCWTPAEKAGTAVVAVLVGLTIVGVIIWGFCRRPKPKRLRTKMERTARKEEKKRRMLNSLLVGIGAEEAMEVVEIEEGGHRRRRRRSRLRHRDTGRGPEHALHNLESALREPSPVPSRQRTASMRAPREALVNSRGSPPGQRVTPPMATSTRSSYYRPKIHDWAQGVESPLAANRGAVLTRPEPGPPPARRVSTREQRGRQREPSNPRFQDESENEGLRKQRHRRSTGDDLMLQGHRDRRRRRDTREDSVPHEHRERRRDGSAEGSEMRA